MKYLLTITALFLSINLIAQERIWADISLGETTLARTTNTQDLPSKYHAIQLQKEKLSQLLQRAQPEFSGKKGLIIPIPMPDGNLENFEIWQSPVMEPGLAKRYPNIQTFKGQSINNPLLTSRLGISQKEFHGLIQSPEGIIAIESIGESTQQFYTVSFFKHSKNQDHLKRNCGTTPSNELGMSEEWLSDFQSKARNNNEPADLYIYKAAIATSGEYAQFHGATTKEAALAEVVGVVNRSNTVFERDLGLRLVLIEENDSIIFIDPTTDPYTNGGEVGISYQENPAAIEKIIPVGQFDIGHVLIAGCGSGVVGIGGGKVCDASKSLGISCQNISNDAQFSFDVFAHEIGHQFHANHSWSSCPGNEEQLFSGTAYEPGGGSTIMSYAGACGGDNNVQNTSDDYFHITNIEEILREKFSGETSSCPDIMPTSNLQPEAIINYENGFFIPISTPFELVGEGRDANDDILTYCWEQYNRGPSTNLGEPVRTSPTFRSFAPTESPFRSFPRNSDIRNNRSDRREVLPTYNRNLTFRLTVRDNNVEVGGIDWASVSFEATDQAGPFLVEFPNQATDVLEVGDFAEIKWDVANTNGNLVNCQKVNIRLSTDGGRTFPITLIENTANDGVHEVVIPDMVTNNARIRVEAADNIFFDMSNQNFEIRPATNAGFTFATAFEEQQVCLPAEVEIDLTTISLANFTDPINFSIESNNANLADLTQSIPSNITPGTDSKVSISFPADYSTAPLTFEIVGTATGIEPIKRQVTLNFIANQFTDFAITAPSNGTSGVGLPLFEWVTSPDATHYEIEVATSPAFGSSIIETANDITANNYTPSIGLPESTIYYWRVRPVNDCGVGPTSEIFAFQTENLSCTSQEATEVPVLISALGTPTRESKMTVTQDITIQDLNIPNLKGSHDWVNHIKASLISPAGTEVILFNNKCIGDIPVNIGFDDESPSAIPCPPVGNNLHQPQEALAAFDGENSFGDWIMRWEVTNTDGEGGAIDGWSLEFCGNITSIGPELITNEVLPVKPKSGRLINDDFLLAMDENNAAAELIYTLVTLPTIGTLLYDKNPVSVGAQFSQADLNNGIFKYRHDTEAIEGNDQFTFTVSDGTGGWIGITPFQIVLSESETTVSTEDILNENLIGLYPNPTKEMVAIDLNPINPKSAQIRIFNVQRQLVFQKNVDNPTVTNIVTNNFNNGLYLVRIEMEEGVVTKKLVVKR